MPYARWIISASSLTACLVLAGCARGPAQSAADLEKELPVQAQAPQGGEAAADAVAAQLDRIAEQWVSRPDAPAASTEPVPPASQGPELAPDDWHARALRLIDSLNTPLDTRPGRVSEVLGLTLTERVGSHETSGELSGGGTYKIWVDALYRETPDKWTVGLSQQPAEGGVLCHFPLNTLRQHLAARGYRANEGVRRRDGGESALYRSTPTPEGVVFVVSADFVGSAGDEQCIRELRINANAPGDEP